MPEAVDASYPASPIVAAKPFISQVVLFPDGRMKFTSVPVRQAARRDTSPLWQRVAADSLRYKHSGLSSIPPEGSPDPTWPKAKFVTESISGRGRMAPKRPNFSQAARSKVKSRGAAIEKRYGRERCHFLTLTLPGSTNAAMTAIAAWSSEISRRTSQWIQRRYPVSEGTHHAVWVWENQKRGALHLHMLLALPDPSELPQFRKDVTDYWYSMLVELSAKSGTDLFAKSPSFSWLNRWDEISDRAVDVATVKKSVAAYLAKYLTKEPNPENKSKELAPSAKYWPAQWWGCTDATRKLEAEMILRVELPRLSGDEVDEWQTFLRDWLNLTAIWNKPVQNPYCSMYTGVVAVAEYDKIKPIFDVFSSLVISAGINPETGLDTSDEYIRLKWSDRWRKLREAGMHNQAQSIYDKYVTPISINDFGVEKFTGRHLEDWIYEVFGLPEDCTYIELEYETAEDMAKRSPLYYCNANSP